MGHGLLKSIFNSSDQKQNGHHVADEIFKFISLNKKCMLIQIWLHFIPMDPTDNKSASFQLIAWCGVGDKPLPE